VSKQVLVEYSILFKNQRFSVIALVRLEFGAPAITSKAPC
jgi:hypothetical protein